MHSTRHGDAARPPEGAPRRAADREESLISLRSRSQSHPLRRALAVTGVCVGAVAGILGTAGVATAATSSGATVNPLTVMYTADPARAAATVVSALPAASAITTASSEATATLRTAESVLGDAADLRADIHSSGIDLGERSEIVTTALRAATDRLADAHVVPVLLFPELARDAAAQTRVVADRVAQVRVSLDEAKAQKAAEQAQREAEAAAAAEAQRQADALAARNTPDGAKAFAAQLAAEKYGWGADQFSCLARLWQKESNWNYQAYNGSSGATGIPQSLPGDKMASFGADWATNAGTQIAWGLDYISRAYGAPCSAWGHSQATNWY